MKICFIYNPKILCGTQLIPGNKQKVKEDLEEPAREQQHKHHNEQLKDNDKGAWITSCLKFAV